VIVSRYSEHMLCRFKLLIAILRRCSEYSNSKADDKSKNERGRDNFRFTLLHLSEI